MLNALARYSRTTIRDADIQTEMHRILRQIDSLQQMPTAAKVSLEDAADRGNREEIHALAQPWPMLAWAIIAEINKKEATQ